MDQVDPYSKREATAEEERVTTKHLRPGDRVYIKGELRTLLRLEKKSPSRTKLVATDGKVDFGGGAAKHTRVGVTDGEGGS